MPGCHEVKAILQWNWLKIGIWDLQTPCSNGMYSVSLDPLGPYPKFGSKRAWIMMHILVNNTHGEANEQKRNVSEQSFIPLAVLAKRGG